jgi:hypothetical protein
MIRRFLVVSLSVFLALPPGARAADETAAASERSSWMGGPFFWGALVLLNGTILTSSIGDLRFYESRADEVSDAGGEADAYWDAASREKVVIGVAALSLLFSLAGFKSSFSKPARVPELPPLARADRAEEAGPELPTPPGPVQVLSLESRVRYDTLLTPGSEEATVEQTPGGVLVSPAEPESTAHAPADRPEPAEAVADIVASLEKSLPPVIEPAGPPAAAPEPAESRTPGEKPPTFTLRPYGVHVSSFRTQALAEKEEVTWRKRGEIVTIEEDEVPGKGIWFRLLIGNFETGSEAKKYADGLRERYGLEYAQVKRRPGF